MAARGWANWRLLDSGCAAGDWLTIDNGVATYPHRPGDHVAPVAGFKTLRDVVYGGSFEGQTTFAIGVRARLPFRIFVLPSDTGGVRIVLDVAHRW